MKRKSRDGKCSLSRRAILLCGSACFGQSAEVVIYANEDWYRDRAEPERQWTGVLEKRDPDPGPSGRPALRFMLKSDERSLPVYAAGVVEKLAPFTGKGVTGKGVLARAKLVDLRSEGYGLELWIGTLRTAR